MYSNDIGKISSRTTKRKLVEITTTKETTIEKRINAINLLAAKKEVDPSDFFGKVLRDKDELTVVKSNLVLRLGRKLKSVRALEKFLGNEDATVNRSILQVLAYRGDATSLKKITAFAKNKRKNSPEMHKVQFAKTLISYRLGDNKELLPKSKAKAFESFRAMKAESIKKQQLTVSKASRIIAEVNEEYKIVPLATEKAQKLHCQGKELAIFLNEAVVNKTFNFNTNGIVASITGDDYCPAGHFIKYHVLLQKDAKSGKHYVHIINPNGRVLMEGPATKKDHTFTFEVKALKRPGSTPILFDASFDLDQSKLNIKEAKSGIGVRKSSRIKLNLLHKD